MQRHRNDSRYLGGFTLVEMLVVLGIIGLLLGILLPVVMRARRAGRSVVCQSNLRQIGQLMLQYANQNDDYLPLGVTAISQAYVNGAEAAHQSTWTNYLSVDDNPSANFGALVACKMINTDDAKILYCPSDPDETLLWRLFESRFPTKEKGFVPQAMVPPIRVSYFGRPVSRIFLHFIAPPGVVAPAIYTRLDDLRGKALFTEWLHGPSAHGTKAQPRVNVLYYDGSVRGVDIQIDEQLPFPPAGAYSTAHAAYESPNTNTLMDPSWLPLDAQYQQ